jgi:hypothetical protein
MHQEHLQEMGLVKRGEIGLLKHILFMSIVIQMQLLMAYYIIGSQRLMLESYAQMDGMFLQMVNYQP